jgi:drug/metabolite transporter (DMT)-like permease
MTARQLRELSVIPSAKEGSATSASPPAGTKSNDRPLLGMLAAGGAFFMLAVMNLFGKFLSGSHHPWEIVFYRNAIAVLPYIIVIFAFKRRHILTIRGKPFMVVIRAIVGIIGLMLTFTAYSMLPMADATAMLFTASLFVPVLGFFFLSEQVSSYRAGAILAGFTGMLIMARPTGDWNGVGIVLAVAAAFLQAVLATLLRLLGRTEKPETVTFYFLFVGAIGAAIPVAFTGSLPLSGEIPWLLGVGVSGAAAQTLLSVAYRYAQATLVTIFNYSGIIWASIFGWMFWDAWPSLSIVAGASVIIMASAIVIVRERMLQRRQAAALPLKA